MKSFYKIFFLAVIINSSFTNSFCQIKDIGLPFIKNYLPSDYNSETQNWGFTQDNRDVLYVANNSSILSYNGIDWQKIEIVNKGNVRSIYKDSKGKIWVGGFNEIGYLSVNETNSIEYKSIISRFPGVLKNINHIWNILEYNDFIVLETDFDVFFLTENRIKSFHSDNGFHNSFKVNNQLYFREFNTGLLKFENDTFKLVNNGDLFKSEKIYSILPFSDGNLLIASRTMGLLKYDGNNFEKWGTQELTDLVINAEIYCGIKIKENYFAFGTLSNGVIILDEQGNLIQNINEENGLVDNIVYSLYLDNFDNLWVATGNGLSYIEISSPLTVFNDYFGLTSKSIFVTFVNGVLYSGGEQNIYKLEWDKTIKFKEKNSFTIVENSNGQSWKPFMIDQRFFISHNPGIIEINKNKADNVFKYKELNIWEVKKIPNTENFYIAGTGSGFLLLKFENKFEFVCEIKGFEHLSRNFEFDKYNNLWVSIPTDGVHKLLLNNKLDSFVNQQYYDEQKGLPSKYNNLVYKFDNEIIFTTIENICKYDYEKDSIFPYEKYNNNKQISEISAIIEKDNLGNIWFSDDFGYGYFNFADDSLVLTRMHAQLFSKNELLSVFALDSGNIFLGFNNGIFHYDSRIKKNYNKQFNTLLQSLEIISNDSLIFGGIFIDKDSTFSTIQSEEQIPKIEFHSNSLRFKVAAIYFENSEEIKYKFKLEGLDDDWSNWTTENTKEYTNLHKGVYIFRAKAINTYQTESQEVYFKFIIRPPWYRTTVAYIFYVICFILFFITFTIILNISYRKRNQRLEERIAERTYKIQYQKTELEKQKAEIEEQTKVLEKINRELVKLSAVASETDNAILIMDPSGNFEWVNPAFTKIFGYTFDELVSGISKNIIGENTSQQIQYLIQVCISEKKTVEYEFKTVDKSGKSIWVHTTLTPVLDDYGEIKNLIAIDSDITKLKVAEEHIQAQNKNITGSIMYALTIQKAILPTTEDLNTFYDTFVIYRPKDIVSGDFYWYFSIEYDSIARNSISKELFSERIINQVGKYIFYAVVDCTGHGVPGAFMSLIGSRLLSEIINERKIFSPKSILETLNKGVKKVLKQSESENNDGMDICICRFEKGLSDNQIFTKVVSSGAKIPMYFYKSDNKIIEKTEPGKITIGGRTNRETDFENSEIQLQTEDYIFIFTDGLKDQSNEKRKKFGTSKTLALLTENINQPPDIIKEKLEISINQWQGSEDQRDDITVMGIKI